jgi:hypothetical protein
VLLVDDSILEEHTTSIFRIEVRRVRIRSWCVEDVYPDPLEGTADRAQSSQ